MASERLQIILQMITGQYTQGARQAATATRQITDAAESADRGFGGLEGTFGKVGKAAAGLAATGAIAAFAKDAVNSAVALEESVNAVNKVFGTAADQITGFGEVASSAVGLANSEFNQLAVNTGALLTNFGFTQEEAADQTLRLAQRASDLASVFNTDVATALDAVNASLRGEQEPIRRFGVSLDDATVRAKAVALGLADTTAAVDQNGKAVAALELIYEQTDKVAGDFLQTQDGLANSARTAAAQWEDAKATFGEIITPAAAASLGFANKALLSIGTLFGSDKAEDALRFGEAVEYLADQLERGSDPARALADAALFLAQNTNLEAGALIALGAQVGITGDALAEVGRTYLPQLIERGDTSRAVILELATAFGILDFAIEQLGDYQLPEPQQGFGFDVRNPFTGEVIANIELGEELVRQVAEGAAEWAKNWEGIPDLVEDTADSFTVLDDAGKDVISTGTKLVGPFGDLNDELFTAQQRARGLGSALLEITNPAFRAAQAAGRLRDAEQNLIDTQGDTEASLTDVNEAALAYAQAKLEAQAANEAFDTAGVENALLGLDLVLQDVGFTAGEVLAQLGVLTEDDWIIRLFLEGNIMEIPDDPRSLFPQEDQDAINRDANRVFDPTPQFVGGVPYFPTTVNNETNIEINNPTTNDLETDLQNASLLETFTSAGGQ